MRGWKGISLAVWTAFAAGQAAAQGPAPLPSAVTAPTPPGIWKDWPTNAPVPTTPGERTMTFRKPAGTSATQIIPVAGQPPAPGPQTPPAGAAQSPMAGFPPSSNTGHDSDPIRANVFRLDDNAVLEARIKAYVGRIDMPIPRLPELTKETYVVRSYPPAKVEIEPGYVVHRRLLFEEKNAERYGWELGAAQPFVSAAYFYRDCLFLPYKVASNIHECYETSAGKCLPGSPVPYYIYPPDFSVTGTVAELGVVTGLAFIFP
jgi:hypothetical protein